MLIITCSCTKNEDNPEEEQDALTFNYPAGTFKMIYCPGGTFLTNDDDQDLDFEDGPEVTCEPFWIAETEMTNSLLRWIYGSAAGSLTGTLVGNPFFFNFEDRAAHNYCCESYVKWGDQYLMYMGGSYDIIFDSGFGVSSGRDDYPCTDITWYGAVMACNWLTQEALGLGLTRVVYSGIDEDWDDDETAGDFDKTGFRLPTANEWECAARWQGSDNSGDCYEYPAGSGNYWTRGGCASGASASTTDVNATALVAVYEYDSDGFTNPADRLKVKGDRLANSLGLYDMNGNVWEWCYDKYGDYSRTARGGSAQSKYHDVRIIADARMSAGGTASDLGFRLVMSADN